MDLAIGALLLAFLAWGFFHGALRQCLGLAVLAAAFLLAPLLAPPLEDAIRKLFDLGRDDLAVAAWATAFVAIAAAGGVVLHALRGPIARVRIGGPFDRWVGGVLGAAKGVVVVGVVAYGLLVWFSHSEGPDLVRALRSSRTARLLEAAERRVEPWLRLPSPVARRVDEVNRSIGGGPA